MVVVKCLGHITEDKTVKQKLNVVAAAAAAAAVAVVVLVVLVVIVLVACISQSEAVSMTSVSTFR